MLILDKCLHVDDNYMSQVTFIIQIFPSPSPILIMSLYGDGQQCSWKRAHLSFYISIKSMNFWKYTMQ